MSFLTAEWRKLAIANYAIDPEVLAPFVPHKTELDLWNDTCYVSLVGFMFLNTKLLGMPIPLHQDFEEVNLRFYVRHKSQDSWKRGVVFIKEIVPKSALTFVANTVYKEHYQTLKMIHSWIEEKDHRIVNYKWGDGNDWHSLKVKAKLDGQEIETGSEDEFITEHYWGYTKVDEHQTYEYEVKHPRWKVYEVMDTDISVDFGKVYGPGFNFMNDIKPKSVMLAEGSEISVENKVRI